MENFVSLISALRMCNVQCTNSARRRLQRISSVSSVLVSAPVLAALLVAAALSWQLGSGLVDASRGDDGNAAILNELPERWQALIGPEMLVKRDNLNPIVAYNQPVYNEGETSDASGGSSTSTAASSNATTDPCLPLLTSNAVFRVSASLACYNSFNLLPSVREGQIYALTSTFQLHPFLDIMRNSSAPYFASFVNLYHELNAIAADNTIASEFQFHSQISLLLKSLKDGHTMYDSACFKAFIYFQPWILGTKYRSDGTPAIYIKGPSANVAPALNGGSSEMATALLNFWQGRGVNLNDYVGYFVYRINGMDPVIYIQQYSDAYFGASRAKDTRFNMMFQSNRWTPAGSFALSDSILWTHNQPTPDMADVRTYQLISADGTKLVTLNVPWAVMVNPTVASNFTSRETYYQSYCIDKTLGANQPTPPSTPGFAIDQADLTTANVWRQALTTGDAPRRWASMSGKYANMINPRWSLSAARSAMFAIQAGFKASRLSGVFAGDVNDETTPETGNPAAAAATGGSSFDLANPLVKDANGAFYNLDGKTGVWVLSTFAPTPLSSQGLSTWMASVVSGLTMLRSQGCSSLLIDVSNNGGGVVCAAAAFLNYLLPNVTFVNYDYRRSPALDVLVNLAFTNNLTDPFYSFLDYKQNGTNITSITQLQPDDNSMLITRGGVTSNYSTKFDVDCAQYITQIKALPSLSSAFSKIGIVSNGMCGSSCANFVRTLREQGGPSVKSYVYGGRGKVFQPTSFEGGKKLSFNEIKSDVAVAAGLLYNSSHPATQVVAGQGDASAGSSSGGGEGSDASSSSSRKRRRNDLHDMAKDAGYTAPLLKLIRRQDDASASAGDASTAAAAAAPASGSLVTDMYPLTPQQTVLLPQPLVRPATASIVFLESYATVAGPNVDMTTPAEWTQSPADGLLVVGDTTDTVSVWKAAAAQLATVTATAAPAAAGNSTAAAAGNATAPAAGSSSAVTGASSGSDASGTATTALPSADPSSPAAAASDAAAAAATPSASGDTGAGGSS